MVRVLPRTFQPAKQRIRLLQVAKSCCRELRVVLLFATKSVHVACLINKPNRENLFCNKWHNYRVRDSWVVLSNEKSVLIHATCNRLYFLQDRFEREWQNTQHRFSTRQCSNVAKQVARFCCLFCRTYNQLNAIFFWINWRHNGYFSCFFFSLSKLEHFFRAT